MKLFKHKKGFSDVIVIAIIAGILGSVFIIGTFVWQELNKNTIVVFKPGNIAEEEIKTNEDVVLEFHLEDLDVDKFDQYLKDNDVSEYRIDIKGINKIIYRDLDGDQRNEAFVEFDTDVYNQNNFFDRLLGYFVEPVYAGGWGVQSAFGVFANNEETELWEPIYADVVYYPVTGMGGEYNSNVMSLVRVDISSRDFGEAYRYGNKFEGVVPTEIEIKKFSCLPHIKDMCAYKLIFKNLEFTKESLN